MYVIFDQRSHVNFVADIFTLDLCVTALRDDVKPNGAEMGRNVGDLETIGGDALAFCVARIPGGLA